ncbi:MAG: hypothetical protein GY754_31755 [bacterium]|nr:hypothetical protein [bacterium]
MKINSGIIKRMMAVAVLGLALMPGCSMETTSGKTLNPPKGIDQSGGVSLEAAVISGNVDNTSGTDPGVVGLQVVAEGELSNYRGTIAANGDYSIDAWVPDDSSYSKNFKIYLEYYDNKIYCHTVSCTGEVITSGANENMDIDFSAL